MECRGATRPALGAKTCVPVGDCSAAFPPPNAIVVDPTAALADALAAAPKGATIALADGTHTIDALTVDKDVTIVGRCAEKTKLVPSASATSGFTLRAMTTLRGLTLSSFPTPLSIKGEYDLVVEDTVIEDAKRRAFIGELDALITIRRSVIRKTAPAANEQTFAIAVGASAHVKIEESAILESVDGAVVATETSGTRAEIVRSVISDTMRRRDGTGGAALRAFEGARIDVVESAILAATGSAILTFRRNPAKAPPSVTVARSVITGTRASEEGGVASGTTINAAFDAKVRIEDTTIADSEGAGLYAAEKARIDVVRSAVVRTSRTRDLSARATSALKEGVLAFEDSAIVRAGSIGVSGWDHGRATLVRTLVRDIGGDTLEGLPAGQGLTVHSGSVIEATDSALVDVRTAGVIASKPSSAVRLDRVLITHTGPPPDPLHHGVVSIDSARVDINQSIIERQGGVAIVGAAGAGVVTSSLVRDNAVAVQVQDGSTLFEVSSVPEEIGPAELVIAGDTHFSNNQVRVGSGIVPLPGVLAPF